MLFIPIHIICILKNDLCLNNEPTSSHRERNERMHHYMGILPHIGMVTLVLWWHSMLLQKQLMFLMRQTFVNYNLNRMAYHLHNFCFPRHTYKRRIKINSSCTHMLFYIVFLFFTFLFWCLVIKWLYNIFPTFPTIMFTFNYQTLQLGVNTSL